MTLRGRLTAAFLAVVLGPIVVSAVAVGIFATSRVRQAESDQLRAASRDVKAAMVLLCERVRGAADGIAVATSISENPDFNLVAQNVATTGAVDAVRVDDNSGHWVAYAGKLPRQYRYENWGDCAADRQASQPLIAAAVPLINAQGQDLGVGRAALLVDSETVRTFRDISDAQVAVEMRNGAWIGSVDEDSLSTRRVKFQPGQPFTVIVGVARQNLSGLYAALFLCTALVVGLALLAAGYMARTLTDPLNELARAAERVSAGSLDTRVPVRGDDETGRLARTVNRMLHDLQMNVAALTASRDQLRGQLANLGQALASGGDQRRILELTLQAAVASTGAQSGVVMLLESSDPTDDSTDEIEDPGVLIARATLGLHSGVDTRNLRVPVGEGILGDVATRAASAAGRVTPGGLQPIATEPLCRTYLAVPLLEKGSGKLVGVLAVYDRLAGSDRVDEFDDSDTIALQSFANNAVAAL